ncbi:hypothetical protein DPMN_045296 [Dreissena polymorpha]|uniref:Endonuclease/exonuclease/phosphatase domain-containing protein n=1 Tax=Dreissena polymorpha TaxID=45954 RepID=A0A9D4D5U3_DREPO|nr:hypothetical protein DPMN_045296 [Dreissena polymorpha]
MEFHECVDLIAEIVEKYENSHDFVIGGDHNVDLASQHPVLARTSYIRELINYYGLKFDSVGKTYINPQGIDWSELDYFSVKTRQQQCVSVKTIINNLDVNLSDHYPICISLTEKFTVKGTKTSAKNKLLRIKWDKIDTQLYSDAMRKRILMLDPTDLKKNTSKIEDPSEIEEFSLKLMTVMTQTIEANSTSLNKRKSNPKLKVWTQKIGHCLKDMREAYKLWCSEGKPRDTDNIIFGNLKTAKKIFRSSYRCEQARRSAQDKDNNINARTRDSKLFHKLINKKRKKKQCIIEDLYVDDEHFNGSDSAATGFKKYVIWTTN